MFISTPMLLLLIVLLLFVGYLIGYGLAVNQFYKAMKNVHHFDDDLQGKSGV